MGIVTNHRSPTINALNAYVVHKNRLRAIFKDRPLDLNSPQDRQSIARSIDAELSPENLTCDGALTRGQVQSRYRHLTAVARDLRELDPTIEFYEFDPVDQ